MLILRVNRLIILLVRIHTLGIGAAVLALALQACAATPTAPPPTLAPSPTVEPIVPTFENTPTAFPPVTDTPRAPTPTIDVTGTAVAEAAVGRTHNDLRVVFDYNRHSLQTTQIITYTNRSEMPLEDIQMIVNPNLQPGVFTLNSLAWAQGDAIEDFTLEKSELVIPLEEPLGSGKTISLALEWGLMLQGRSGELGYTDLQANLIDWYPFIPPYEDSQGWIVNKPWPYGEYLVYETANFSVRLQLTGAVIPVVGTGAPVREDGDWMLYTLENARSFAWSASPHYELQTQQAAGVEVSVYFYPGHQVAAAAALEAAVQALDLFSELFGAYPRPVFNIIEASFSDGMEFDGLIFLSQGYLAGYDGTPQNFLTVLAVHETAHQWWFGLVGNNQALEPWLDEALSTYSELLYYERFHPELVDWWWLFRVNYFNPQGFINGTIYDYGRFPPYFSAVYHRGAQFHRDLRAALGDEAYLDFLRAYTATYPLKIVSGEAFLSLLEDISPVELDSLLAEYFGPEN